MKKAAKRKSPNWGGHRPGAGRPAKGLDDSIRVVCSPSQKAAWQKAADKADVPLSQWVRDALDAASKP